MQTTINEDSSTATKQKGQALKLICVQGKVKSKRKTQQMNALSIPHLLVWSSLTTLSGVRGKINCSLNTAIVSILMMIKECNSQDGDVNDYSNSSTSRQFKLDSC